MCHKHSNNISSPIKKLSGLHVYISSKNVSKFFQIFLIFYTRSEIKSFKRIVIAISLKSANKIFLYCGIFRILNSQWNFFCRIFLTGLCSLSRCATLLLMQAQKQHSLLPCRNSRTTSSLSMIFCIVRLYSILSNNTRG